MAFCWMSCCRYYNPMDIVRDYNGGITGYAAPKDRHPSSIMSVSNTGVQPSTCLMHLLSDLPLAPAPEQDSA